LSPIEAERVRHGENQTDQREKYDGAERAAAGFAATGAFGGAGEHVKTEAGVRRSRGFTQQGGEFEIVTHHWLP
jgi:hypothetical protein